MVQQPGWLSGMVAFSQGGSEQLCFRIGASLLRCKADEPEPQAQVSQGWSAR